MTRAHRSTSVVERSARVPAGAAGEARRGDGAGGDERRAPTSRPSRVDPDLAEPLPRRDRQIERRAGRRPARRAVARRGRAGRASAAATRSRSRARTRWQRVGVRAVRSTIGVAPVAARVPRSRSDARSAFRCSSRRRAEDRRVDASHRPGARRRPPTSRRRSVWPVFTPSRPGIRVEQVVARVERPATRDVRGRRRARSGGRPDGASAMRASLVTSRALETWPGASSPSGRTKCVSRRPSSPRLRVHHRDEARPGSRGRRSPRARRRRRSRSGSARPRSGRARNPLPCAQEDGRLADRRSTASGTVTTRPAARARA